MTSEIATPFRCRTTCLLLAVVTSLCSSCQRDREVHPEVKTALTFIASKDCDGLWTQLAPLVPLLRTEGQVQRLAVDRDKVFAIYEKRVLDATWRGGHLTPTANPSQWEQHELEHIAQLIGLMADHGASGYDRRSLSEYLRIFVRNDVYFLVLSDDTSSRFRHEFVADARKGYDSRGDAIRQINTNLFIATERR